MSVPQGLLPVEQACLQYMYTYRMGDVYNDFLLLSTSHQLFLLSCKHAYMYIMHVIYKCMDNIYTLHNFVSHVYMYMYMYIYM